MGCGLLKRQPWHRISHSFNRHFMSRHYQYAGPLHCIPKADEMPVRFRVTQAMDVQKWQFVTAPEEEYDGSYAATFIVDLDGQLWIADRRSEHVACARAAAVLAAGEMFFEIRQKNVCILRVTNQSTGYCPEPASWEAVAHALRPTGIPHPAGYEDPFEFRFCVPCRNICLIKDDDFTCPRCEAPLPEFWNLDEAWRANDHQG